MDNIINNTVMNYSALWPKGAQGVAGGLPTGKTGADPAPGQGTIFVRPSITQTGSGWLPAGMGQNVDLLV